jgi:hypothetical protein
MLRLKNSVSKDVHQDASARGPKNTYTITPFLSSRTSKLNSDTELSQKVHKKEFILPKTQPKRAITPRDLETNSLNTRKARGKLNSRTHTTLDVSHARDEQQDEATRIEEAVHSETKKSHSKATSIHMQEFFNIKSIPKKPLSSKLQDMIKLGYAKQGDLGNSFDKMGSRSIVRSRLALGYNQTSFWQDSKPRGFSLTHSQGFLVDSDSKAGMEHVDSQVVMSN